MLDKMTYSFPNFHGGTMEVLELINNLISLFTPYVIIYLCWD